MSASNIFAALAFVISVFALASSREALNHEKRLVLVELSREAYSLISERRDVLERIIESNNGFYGAYIVKCPQNIERSTEIHNRSVKHWIDFAGDNSRKLHLILGRELGGDLDSAINFGFASLHLYNAGRSRVESAIWRLSQKTHFFDRIESVDCDAEMEWWMDAANEEFESELSSSGRLKPHKKIPPS